MSQESYLVGDVQLCIILYVNIRVGKCHGYDGYIRVKKLASWGKKFGRPKYLAKTSHFGKICAKNLRSMDKLPSSVLYV